MDTEDTAGKIGSTAAIDFSRAPIGVKAASALVEALVEHDDRVERHYLEVKSEVGQSKTELSKIAKFILGAANRMPEVAATAFGGSGVMVIGVKYGAIIGVPPIEILEIRRAVDPFLGPNGPHWDLTYVPVDKSTNSVLVVVVDPPRNGQDPFVCQKDGDILKSGRIYVRADGETREANAQEVDQLLERGKRQVGTVPEFVVTMEGAAYPLGVDNRLTLDAYVEAESRRLLSALPEPKPRETRGAGPTFVSADKASGAMDEISSNAPTGVSMSGIGQLRASQIDAISKAMDAVSRAVKAQVPIIAEDTMPENRTVDEYRAEIDEWRREVRHSWPAAIKAVAGSILDPVTIRVENRTRAFLEGVELRIHLGGDVEGVERQEGGLEVGHRGLGLSETPQVWGPKQRPSFVNMVPYRPFVPVMPDSSAYWSPLEWTNGGSVDVKLEIGDLRPLGKFEHVDSDLVLVLPFSHENPVKGTWSITASGHDEIFSGELAVQAAKPLDLTGPVRRLLDLGDQD